jgi:antitoxin component HigA of HigAB toxin-antitoxin module
MARTIGMESLRQKIEKAQDKVIRTKAAYDEAVDELQKLLDKQTALQTEEIVKAIANSSKSYSEILEFIRGTSNDEGDE